MVLGSEFMPILTLSINNQKINYQILEEHTEFVIAIKYSGFCRRHQFVATASWITEFNFGDVVAAASNCDQIAWG